MDSVAIVIPALESNVYHEDGDLAPFGDMTLLEWKFAQVRDLVPANQIYVTSPSDKIASVVEKSDFKFITRSEDLTISEMIEHAISCVEEETLLWTYVTSPYVSPNEYRKYLHQYFLLDEPYDSLATSSRLNQYVFYKERALNFELHAHGSRKLITPVHVVTNGCFVISRNLAAQTGSYYGRHPFLYEVDRLSALEIDTFDDLAIANDLMAHYVRSKMESTS